MRQLRAGERTQTRLLERAADAIFTAVHEAAHETVRRVLGLRAADYITVQGRGEDGGHVIAADALAADRPERSMVCAQGIVFLAVKLRA